MGFWGLEKGGIVDKRGIQACGGMNGVGEYRCSWRGCDVVDRSLFVAALAVFLYHFSARFGGFL